MITLTPEDIAAIADAVVARLQGAAVNPVLTVEQEIAAVQMRGGSVAEYYKAKAGMMTDKRRMDLRQTFYEIGRASKDQSKRRTKKSATTTASTETPKGARKTTDV